jgi:hypothetical protein
MRRGTRDAAELAELMGQAGMAAGAEPPKLQRNLSVSCNKLGHLLLALGQGEQARSFFDRSLQISERLARAEPDRADFQRDLLVSLLHMISVDAEGADAYRTRGQAILHALESRGALVQQMREFREAFGL